MNFLMSDEINYNKKILLNLDGYQLNVFVEPIKKILSEYPIKIALHCASLDDKKILETNFEKNIKIYCYEEYVRENYKEVKAEDFSLFSSLSGLSIEEIDLAFEFYNDSSLWWFIAQTNNLSTMNVPKGTSLRISFNTSFAIGR